MGYNIILHFILTNESLLFSTVSSIFCEWKIRCQFNIPKEVIAFFFETLWWNKTNGVILDVVASKKVLLEVDKFIELNKSICVFIAANTAHDYNTNIKKCSCKQTVRSLSLISNFVSLSVILSTVCVKWWDNQFYQVLKRFWRFDISLNLIRHCQTSILIKFKWSEKYILTCKQYRKLLMNEKALLRPSNKYHLTTCSLAE